LRSSYETLPLSLWEKKSDFPLSTSLNKKILDYILPNNGGEVIFFQTGFSWDDLLLLEDHIEITNRTIAKGSDEIGGYVSFSIDRAGKNNVTAISHVSFVFFKEKDKPECQYVFANLESVSPRGHNYFLLREGNLQFLINLLHKLDINGRYWVGTSSVEPTSIIEMDETRYIFQNGLVENIFQNTTNFLLGDLQQYRKLELTPKRGILLHGPPGNGKTALCKMIIKRALNEGVNAIFFDLESVRKRRDDFQGLFRWAVNKSPVCIFFDDLDLLIAKRDSDNSALMLGDFLHTMDGLETTEGFTVVATTNTLKTLDPAILRPGRFDIHIPVPKPNRSQIHIALPRLLKLSNIELPKKVLAKLEGLSFAELDELAKRYKLDWLSREQSDMYLLNYLWDIKIFEEILDNFKVKSHNSEENISEESA
jgi:hypothetical protein